MAAALALALTPLLFLHPVKVSGRSMEPLLQNGELRWVLRSWCAGGPAPGQIWVVRTPGGTAVKRLVAGPGTRVELRDGDLWLDGKPVEEPYVARSERAAGGPWDTGSGFFLLGDNRPESQDSRTWGALPASSLQGRLLVR